MASQSRAVHEKTEVIHGRDSALDVFYDFFRRADKRLDICAIAIPPREVNKRIDELYVGITARGGRLRLVTDINKENLAYIKDSSNRIEIRHVPGVGGNFAVSDSEYLATLGTAEFNPGSEILYSNERIVVRHHQALFEALWERGIPAEQRVSEMELGVVPSHTELIYDSAKIRRKFFEMLRDAQEEVLLFLASSNSFLRAERIGIIASLEEAATTRGLQVKLLTPMDSKVEDLLSGVPKVGRKDFPIRITRISPRGDEGAVDILIVDRKASLLIERKEDAHEDFERALRSGMYSTNLVTARANLLLFESLWDSASLVEQETERTSQLASTIMGAFEPAWRITPANYNCVRCGKRVLYEIRIHEPRVMGGESKAVSSAMQAVKAGWIPFCFDCIRNHRTLKPAWLVVEPPHDQSKKPT